MFRKTRRKIVFTVVFSLFALLLVTLSTLYLSNRIAHERENDEMLKTYAERFSLEERDAPEEQFRPDEKPDFKPDAPDAPDAPQNERFGKNEPAFRLSTFYAVAYSENGEALSISNENSALQSEESLLETAADILKSGKKSGKAGNLTYLVEERDDYTLVAMLDQTIDDNNQSLLIRQMLIIGSGAMVILFVLSIFIARRIVRPLEESDQRQKRFVSDAGHELKTPIAVISANSELLRRLNGDSEWLDNIDYENERMSDLVKQLLVLSKAETGEILKETLDFSKLVSGELLPFETLAYEKGKRIFSDVEPGLLLDGNANQLRQLISILLDNALSHGTTDTIALSLQKEKHRAVLAVSNGAGEMSSEQLSHLFERFYRIDEARNEENAHYGLGLSIAKAITESHGGEIHADYQNKNAVFTVSLPLKKT